MVASQSINQSINKQERKTLWNALWKETAPRMGEGRPIRGVEVCKSLLKLKSQCEPCKHKTCMSATNGTNRRRAEQSERVDINR